MTTSALQFTIARVIAKSGPVALWLNGLTNKFGNWPFGAHVIRFATGVYKHQSVCMLSGARSGASFINGMHIANF